MTAVEWVMQLHDEFEFGDPMFWQRMPWCMFQALQTLLMVRIVRRRQQTDAP